MLGADINCDGVEEVLVVVVAGEAAGVFEAEDVFEGGAFELCVGHGGDVEEGRGGGFGVGAAFAGGGGELVVHERVPAVFVFGEDGLDHYFEKVGAGLDADNVEDATFGFGEESFNFGIRI